MTDCGWAMTAKTQLLETMQKEREAWDALVGQFRSARMMQPGAAGYWSVKDVVAHITAYERWLAEWLESAALQQFPGPSVLDDADVDRRNRRIYEATHTLPPEQVMQEALEVFQRLLRAVEALPDECLTDARQAEWFMKPYWSRIRTVPDAVANLSYQHYHEHIPDLQRWLEESES